MFNRFIQPVMLTGIGIAILLTIVGLASKSTEVLAAPLQQETTQRRQINVSGTGRVMTPPDKATINIGVQFTAPTLAEATQQASATMTKVLDAIKAQGVDAKDIQTSTYSVNPITNYKEGQPPQITGYQVMNVVTVTVKDLDNLGKVLDAGMGAGANYLGGVFFGIANPAEVETQARTAAVKDATQIAQTLAQAAGVKLGRVLSITEGVGTPPPPVFRSTAMAADAAGAGPVETGSLEVMVNVVMTFEIAE